jgi:hypothetical protein
MARWEWVRWVNATANPATRQRRVEVTISKMNNGKRRPCCFDLAACTDPAVAKNGKLRIQRNARCVRYSITRQVGTVWKVRRYARVVTGSVIP